MPKTNALTLEGQVKQAVIDQADDLDTKLHKAKISFQDIADITNLTRQAVGIQFRNKRLMPEVQAAATILLEAVNK